MRLPSLSILTIVFLSASPIFADDSLAYFPRDYESSRARFLRRSAELARRHPGAEPFAIPVGEEGLTVDTLYLPAAERPRSLLVLTSGNHGPEGYAGSALQALFVEEILPTLELRDTGVLLVHALNPWGFKHHRRGTERNVNLNRNFDLSRDLFATRNDEYDRLRKFLEPSGKVCRAGEFPAKDLLLEMILKKEVTQQSLTEAIGKGQYASPDGINFGGRDFEPQTLAMIERFRRVAEPYRAIFHVDLHTGLGKRGVLHVMTKKGMNAVSRRATETLFADPRDAGRYELTPPEAEGFYEIHGDYANILAKLFPGEDRIIVPITAEFGTVGNGLKGKTLTINRLILENQGHLHGFASEAAARKVKRRYLELFYPASAQWRRGVLADGRYLLDTVVRRFIAQHP